MVDTLRRLNLVLEDDGSVRSITAEYVEPQADGPDKPVGRKRLTEAELVKALPDQAALLAQIDVMTADRASELEAHKTERDAMQAERDRYKAERDVFERELDPPRYLAKSIVIERLAAVGLADTAFKALEAEPALRNAWQEAGPDRLNVKDARVPAFVTAIGGDPDVILAPETKKENTRVGI